MNYTQVIIGVLSLFAFSSCEKLINVDLKNAEPRLVIEGIVDDTGNPAKVVISKSAVFSAGNNYPKVSSAVVNITDNLGNIFLLAETSEGTYTNTTLTGVMGRTYKLTVLLDGKTYTASSTVTRKGILDSLVIDNNPFSGSLGGGDSEKWVGVAYTDPVGYGDNFQVVQTINGKKDRITHVADDLYSDGGSSPFFMSTGKIKLKVGDTVRQELRFIDKNVYRYLLGIQNLADGFTIPENPNSNISGNVLGFFSAHTSQTKAIVLQ